MQREREGFIHQRDSFIEEFYKTEEMVTVDQYFSRKRILERVVK